MLGCRGIVSIQTAFNATLIWWRLNISTNNVNYNALVHLLPIIIYFNCEEIILDSMIHRAHDHLVPFDDITFSY